MGVVLLILLLFLPFFIIWRIAAVVSDLTRASAEAVEFFGLRVTLAISASSGIAGFVCAYSYLSSSVPELTLFGRVAFSVCGGVVGLLIGPGLAQCLIGLALLYLMWLLGSACCRAMFV